MAGCGQKRTKTDVSFAIEPFWRGCRAAKRHDEQLDVRNAGQRALRLVARVLSHGRDQTPSPKIVSSPAALLVTHCTTQGAGA
jgi:hypothetical protein